MEKKRITKTFQLTEELLERIGRVAGKEKIEDSKVIRKAIEMYCDRILGVPKK